MNEPDSTLADPTNKKEHIIKLLAQGKVSTKDIARIVGTTEAYVWKEKSKFKTKGMSVRRNTEVISKTGQLNIYNNNALLSIPQLDQEGLRKLYSEFGLGKKPAQVIAENGFHPELVESEYQRYLRLIEYDLDALEGKFFGQFKKDELTSNNREINALIEKYKANAKLTAQEFVTLIRLIVDEKYQLGKASLLHDIISGFLPNGWEWVPCLNCNKPMSGSIEDSVTKLRITITDRSIPLTHVPSCDAPRQIHL